MSALLAAALLQAAAPLACTGICDAPAIAPFLARLAAARHRGAPVRIVQIGDSHTAADQVTGSWRALLQQRFGSGGRGVLAPGRPYQGYLTRGITARQSPGWSTNGIFGAAYASIGAAPLGLSAYSATAAAAGAWMTLTADPEQTFDRFTVCAMTGPDAGAITLTVGTTSVAWRLDAPETAPDCRTVATPGGLVASSGVTVDRGPVTLTSWATERADAGGVVLSNLGIVGAQFTHWSRTDEAVVARELAAYRPDLIVVAFGTNEAFWPRFTATGYDASLAAGLARLRRLAPRVPLMLLGAPDSATALPGLQQLGGLFSPPCTAASPWRPTAALPLVQSVAARRAHAAGAAYWDWSARMGGRCTADRWARSVPPLMRGDRVHFTRTGGEEIARSLESDLEAAIDAAPQR